MAGGITETGTQYSTAVGLIYVFNLIVGTGALAMPAAFSAAGWLISLITVIILAAMSYMTTTFVIESMAVANVKLKLKSWKTSTQGLPDSSPDKEFEDEIQPLLPERPGLSDPSELFAIKERVELGQMASMFFNKYGVNLFYLCIAIYLFGDMSIYCAAVPKSLRDVMCTYRLSNNGSSGLTANLTDDDPCWPGVDNISRMNAYRLALMLFILLLGPFVFFNAQKTKYLQIFTSIMRWLAFISMIVLAVIKLAKGQGLGHPPVADISGLPNLFGVCVYAFMCHHSLPSLITPIKDKSKLNPLLAADYTLILGFYALLSFTGIYAVHDVKDLYTLNFEPDTPEPITNIEFFQYFLALFPVFTLSTNFPIIAITLRNNLKAIPLFYNELRPYPWCVDKVVFPLVAILPPVGIAMATNQVEFLVGITGSYAGAGIQYIIPVFLVYYARKMAIYDVGSVLMNKHRSPFRHNAWLIFVIVWALLCVVFVTVNHIITKK